MPWYLFNARINNRGTSLRGAYALVLATPRPPALASVQDVSQRATLMTLIDEDPARTGPGLESRVQKG